MRYFRDDVIVSSAGNLFACEPPLSTSVTKLKYKMQFIPINKIWKRATPICMKTYTSAAKDQGEEKK